MFISKDEVPKWNGITNGSPVSQGVYVVVVQFLNNLENKEDIIIQDLTVIK